MSFQLSPEMDRNKIFLTQRSELEGRLDPSFYTPEKRAFFEKLKSNNDIVPLKDIMSDGSYGILPPGDSYDDSCPILFVRATELCPNLEIDLESVNRVEEQYFFHKRARLKDKDILIAVKGATIASKKSIAYVDTAPEKAIVNGSIFRFQVRYDVNPKFVAYMLDLVITKQQMKYNLVANNAVDYLDKPLINKLLIYTPAREIQNQIVTKMDSAHATRKQKEAEAQRLLDSIDDYLLGELGINLPESEENTLQSRVFYRKMSEVSGGRFDAPVHYRDFSLSTKSYPMARLKDCVYINPLTSFYTLEENTMATFIPMECVSDQYGEADLSQRRIIAESSGYTRFLENDLIWAKITPCMQNGKSAVASNLMSGIGFGSTEFHVFRAKEGVDIRYIYALLRLKSLREYAVLYFSGSAGHQRVSDEFFYRLDIPKPPINKQAQIAEAITDIRNRVKNLQQETETEIEKVKAEVGQMILGQKS